MLPCGIKTAKKDFLVEMLSFLTGISSFKNVTPWKYGGFISTEKTRDYQTIATQIPRLHSFVPRKIYISRKLGKMPHEEGDLRYKRQTNNNLPSERTFMWMKENKLCLPRTASTREVLLAQR